MRPAATDLRQRHTAHDFQLQDTAGQRGLPNPNPDPDPSPNANPRCADFFLDHGQYDKAVRLFTQAGECTKALDLCVLHNIALTEEVAESAPQA